MVQQTYCFAKIADGAAYEIDTNRARLDHNVIHGFLSRSHWAQGIPRAVLRRAIGHSMPFGLYKNGRQIGFARVVTDHATFAYLADVFVLPGERGRGLGRWLVQVVLDHPDLQGLRRWLLGSRDAQGLYRKLGFDQPAPPFAFLERLDQQVYRHPGLAVSAGAY